MPSAAATRRPLGLVLVCTVAAAQAQPAPEPASAPPTERSAPAASAPAPSAAASAPARPPEGTPPPAPEPTSGQQVEITGGRETDTDLRRQSTTARIVIGRDEIDRFGDATVGEVLRRLPGVTTPGAPGRGGPPRLRGLGGGFTQLLIDGQRIPRGFSLESLTSEQVERIEILRAPTAETGARAIAGTINIVTREGFTRRINDLRLSAAVENGEFSPGLNWTHNDNRGPLTYNLSAGAFRNQRLSSGRSETTEEDLASGELTGQENATSQTQATRSGLNVSGRLQWRLSQAGDQFTLMPSVFHSDNRTRSDFTLTQTLPPPSALPDYDLAEAAGEGRFTRARLGAQWRQRLTSGARLELDGGLGGWRSHNASTRLEYRTGETTPLRRNDEDNRSQETSGNATLKFTQLLGGDGDGGSGDTAGGPGNEHQFVGGVEIEGARRNDERLSLEDGVPQLTEFGDELQASTLRLAGYVQDEWRLNRQWSLHAGLRWEGIETRGDAGDGRHPVNRSSVWTPLVHVLWKPDPKTRDQIRLSLTRSYRSPALSQLIARPWVNRRFPAEGPNEPTHPDSAGNPTLQPELASGLDLAFERYLERGGLLNANLFVRQLSSVIRNVVTLEPVSYSPLPRWVSRPQNIGDASTQGLELEARFRLDQLVDDAARVELRGNLGLYRSSVEGIPGPDDRLDGQAPATLNLGADYRLRSLPLSVGGNFNWVPGYRTQQAPDRAVTVSRKIVHDAYALWTFSPAVGLRLLASNLLPRDYETSNQFDTDTLRETSRSVAPSYTSWQLRLEMKL
jgi:iron complex outermembrane receptor protein